MLPHRTVGTSTVNGRDKSLHVNSVSTFRKQNHPCPTIACVKLTGKCKMVRVSLTCSITSSGLETLSNVCSHLDLRECLGYFWFANLTLRVFLRPVTGVTSIFCIALCVSLAMPRFLISLLASLARFARSFIYWCLSSASG
jgi:hypothetical protein